MGPTKMTITQTICAYDKPRLIVWSKAFGARWLLLAVREQHLEPLSETSCSHHNTERLTGVQAPIVHLCFGGYMRRGFQDAGEGLKRHAEALYAKTKIDGLSPSLRGRNAP